MTDRERFLATMRYGPRDRPPICDFGFWDEVPDIWHHQGLPASVNLDNISSFFGMDSWSDEIGINNWLAPSFEYAVVEDQGDFEIVQDHTGVRLLRQKWMGSIPQHLGHLLTDRASWEKHYKPRLDPDTPARLPADFAERVARWNEPNYPGVRTIPGGSLYGWLRDWMGMENVSLIVYDDPALFEEMVETLANVTLGTLQRAFDAGLTADACSMWEDMCYKNGPLLSPALFRTYLVPHYRRITELLRKNGVEVIYLDCDGFIEALMPMWLESGINCMFPLEVGTWGADPVRYRGQFGKDMLMLGGFDKHILARSKSEITKEIERLAPLVEEGGFIPFCDHRVPADVPYTHYVHYLETARQVWGQNTNLKPLCRLPV
jgi:hypothetical protein